MNEKDFQYTLMVAKCHSFSRAAQLLYLSQPALSRYISNLEKQLGIILFDRSISPVKLTSAGQRFCAYATEILELENKLRSELQTCVPLSGRAIKLGVPLVTGEYMLSRMLPQLMKKYPSMRIDPVQDISSNLCQRLAAHQLDVAFVCTPMESASLYSIPLVSEDMYLVGNRSHPALTNYDTSTADVDNPLKIDFTQLKGVAIIHCKPIAILSYQAEEILKRLQFRPETEIKASSMPLALDLAVQGMGFTSVLRCQLKYEHPEKVEHLCPIYLGDKFPFYVTYNELIRSTTPELDIFIQEVLKEYQAKPYI